jgi:hypothetical protein
MWAGGHLAKEEFLPTSALKMEARLSTVTLVNLYKSTRSQAPEDNVSHSDQREKP